MPPVAAAPPHRRTAAPALIRTPLRLTGAPTSAPTAREVWVIMVV